MLHPITVADEGSDWAMKDRFLVPRSTPGYLTREEVVEAYGELDVEGIELNHIYWDDYAPRALRTLADGAGLEIISYGFFADLAAPTGDRRAAVAEAFALMDRTAELGAPLAYIIAGTAKDGVALDLQRKWMAEGLHECAERARSLGMTLVAENIDDPPSRPLMGRGADCRDICAQVDSPNFRLVYDSGAPVSVGEDSLATLDEMAPFVAHVHVKNNRPLSAGDQAERFMETVDGQRYEGTLLDRGDLDIEAIMARLDGLGYDGYVQIEYQGVGDPRSAFSHNVAYLRGVMKGAAGEER